ncbi:MAG: EAL domain-containing protein [Acidimicrobiia bacterium]|nr:EAL domain-containing protein [Acidimicrobiia bacterium]
MKNHFEFAFDAALIGMSLVSTDGRFLDVNPAFAAMLGLERSDLIGRTFQEITHPEDLEADVGQLERCLSGEIDGYEMDKRYIRSDGREIWVHLHVGVVRDPAGSALHFVSQVQDITEQLHQLDALETSRARFAAMVEHGSDLIAICDIEGKLRYASPAYSRVLGLDPEGAIGVDLLELVHPDDREKVITIGAELLDQPKGSMTFDFRFAHADGSWRWVEATLTNRLEDPAVAGFVVNTRDVTERIATTERLTHQATHDPLTGLPNRTLLEDRLVQARASARRHAETLALLYLDIDYFKVINDRHGHVFGDHVLVAAAERLTASARTGDTIARLGGDEFVIVAGLADVRAADELARRICRAFDDPFTIDGHLVQTSVSIGLAIDDGFDTGVGLIEAADHALYEAKAAGRGRWAWFEASGSELTAIGAAATQPDTPLSPELARLANRYRANLDAAAQPLVVHIEGQVVAVTAASVELLGYCTGEELLGRHLFDFVMNLSLDPASAADRAALSEGWAEPVVAELRRSDGSPVVVEVSTLPVIWDGRPAHQLLLCPMDPDWRDLASAAQVEARGEPALVTDLDLRIVAWNEEAAAIFGWDDRRALGQPLGTEVPISTGDGGMGRALAEVFSMGAWTGPAHQRLPDGSVVAVEVSIDLVRSSIGRPIGFCIASGVDAAPADAERDSELLAELARAVDRNELVVAYQPIVDADGCTVKVEALVRWQHPSRGLLLPGSFVPAAERSPWMRALTSDVLHQACEQVARWRADAAPDLELTVNVSARDLADPALIDDVLDALRATRLPPEALWLEVTETSVAIDDDVTIAGLAQLKSIGVRLALDDFGTGFANLAQLHRFTPQALKIDRVFIDRLAANEHDATIVRAVLRLGRDLDVTVIAEGVETVDQHARLREMGCSLFQGYLFSGPQPPDPTPPWLTRALRPRAVETPPSREADRVDG